MNNMNMIVNNSLSEIKYIFAYKELLLQKLKNKKLFGKKVIAYITKHTEEIDSLNQFNYINYLLKKEL